MKGLKGLYFSGFLALAMLVPFSVGAVEGGRYFIKSNSQFWKNAYNARHEFKDGFTADLNDWQIRFGKLLGVTIESVPVLQILPEEADRKSTRLNSSHSQISYAAFFLK